MPRHFNTIITSVISGLTVDRFASSYTHDNIPSHQRNYVWTWEDENRFVDSIMLLPVFGVGILVFRDGLRKWIEDGQNRLKCIQRFLRDEFAWKSSEDSVCRKYSEFSAAEKLHFMSVQMPCHEYEGATLPQRITIFARHQGGRKLTSGEMYHSHMHISALVRLAIGWFFDAAGPFYPRLTNIWGAKKPVSEKDRRYKTLEVMVAITACLLTGDINKLSLKYLDIAPLLANEWTPEQVDTAVGRLNRLINIYEEADNREAMPNGASGNQLKKYQGDVGAFTGYILHGMFHDPEIPDFDNRMAEKLADHRRRRIQFPKYKDKLALAESFHQELGVARSWNKERWENGIKCVFYPEDPRPEVPVDPIDAIFAEDEEDTDSE